MVVWIWLGSNDHPDEEGTESHRHRVGDPRRAPRSNDHPDEEGTERISELSIVPLAGVSSNDHPDEEGTERKKQQTPPPTRRGSNDHPDEEGTERFLLQGGQVMRTAPTIIPMRRELKVSSLSSELRLWVRAPTIIPMRRELKE